jgi:peptide chain release factor subunit 3
MQYGQYQQAPQTQAVPTIAKRPEQSAPAPAPVSAASTSDLNKPVATKEGGAKVLSIGGDAAKPKAAKVLSIGVPAPPKEEPKTEPKEDTPAEKEAAADAGSKVTAAKAIEKTGESTKPTKSSSGKTSPTPSSGRSSPTRGAKNSRDVDAVVNEQSADVDEETLKEIYGKEHVNVIFLGHVDAGKSTLGGSILYATGMVDERTSKLFPISPLEGPPFFFFFSRPIVGLEKAPNCLCPAGFALHQVKEMC